MKKREAGPDKVTYLNQILNEKFNDIPVLPKTLKFLEKNQ